MVKKNLKATPQETYITLENLTNFKQKYDEKLNGNLNEHSYSKTEIDQKVNDTKTEINTRIDNLEAGRVWKPSVDTFNKITETYPEPQDTWCVITKDTNIIWMYDAEKTQWIDLGHSVVHDNATTEKDGLLSKEDKAKIDGMEQSINNAKQEVDNKVTQLSTKHDTEKQALEQSINGIDTAYKEADKTIDGKITALTQTHNTDKTDLEAKIKAVDDKFVAATEEQINGLFA